MISQLNEHKVCTFCVMDSSTPGVEFDLSGQCNCCRDALLRLPHEWWPGTEGNARLDSMIQMLKLAGQGKPYDAMIGLSGGIDSAYLAHLAVREWGLRVLAVHVDGGWNSEPAVRNIELIVRNLDIDLYTYVVDWQEMRDLQLAFLKASVLNQDMPQDHAFFSTLYRTAKKFGLNYFLSGVNFASESVVPIGFGFPYSDDVHLKALHRKFGERPLVKYPIMSFVQYLWLTRIRRQLVIFKPLNYLCYDKSNAKIILEKEYGWRDYGSKHSESRFTKFYQDVYLPRKFNFDKRRLHLSSLIVSGHISRELALQELAGPAASPKQMQRDIKFVAKKLQLKSEELNSFIDSPAVEHCKYPNQQRFFIILRFFKKILIGLRD